SPTSPGLRSPASSPAAAAPEDRRRAEVWAGSLSSLLGGAGDQLGAGWVPVYIGDASLQDNPDNRMAVLTDNHLHVTRFTVTMQMNWMAKKN
ncbi:hypothetical protein HK405_010302, partial [Cladochytrium tenue]